MRRLSLAAPLTLAAAVMGQTQNFDPPNARTPDGATRTAIADKLALLAKEAAGSPDVEVFHKAGEWITRHGEWFTADSGKQTLAVLDRGLKRAAAGAAPPAPGQCTVFGYRSKVDGSVHPIAVTLPPDFGTDPARRWRLDVVLHGRDASLTEVKFVHGHDGKPAPRDLHFVQLEVYGRGNNAYRWGGETDVLEAIGRVKELLPGRLDDRRVVLRGFSMGGAGSWHLGLHRPDRWCVIGPGAGFSTTRGYLKNLPEKLPPHVEKCLRIYDAVEYAENAAAVPVVAYAGANDPQVAAGRAVEARLKPLGLPMTFLVAPDLEHKMPPEWMKKAEAEYAKYAGPGRPAFPERVRFVTWTLKYPDCDWVRLLELDEHYRKATVDARRSGGEVAVTVENVRWLRLDFPAGEKLAGPIMVNGRSVPFAGGPGANLLRVGDDWRAWPTDAPGIGPGPAGSLYRKRPGLTGPIDDAFTGPFLCVRGTGTPWHPAAAAESPAALRRFAAEWDKWMRGTLPVKDDTAVTADDIASKHLILFGDPASNALIARVLPKLPLTWTREELTVAGKRYDPAAHLPALVHPNPLAANRYVVLNSGHTFHAADFKGTNALLYPRLGDWAVLKPGTAGSPAAVEAAGLFDDDWRVAAD